MRLGPAIGKRVAGEEHREWKFLANMGVICRDRPEGHGGVYLITAVTGP